MFNNGIVYSNHCFQNEIIIIDLFKKNTNLSSFDFIPIQFYTSIYYNIMLLVVLFVFYYTHTTSIDNKRNQGFIKVAGFFLLWFVFLYLGLRPINSIFIDMITYAHIFVNYQEGGHKVSIEDNDLFFQIFTMLCSKIMPIKIYFLLCAILYVMPMYVISKKWFEKYWFYAFLMLVISFSFWGYGTNGIRNGLATSFFLLALSCNKRIYQIIWMVCAVGFHNTLLLPSLGFIITSFYNTPKSFFLLWIISIPLSLIFSSFWESFFANFIDDNRVSYLTSEVDVNSFSRIGFRWDFLLYSATGVFAGGYYLFKKKIKDETYSQLFNIYLFANTFWILVIRANYSNRFAYLSWFILALVIIYPWLKYNFTGKQTMKMGWIILTYFSFTYFMNFI